MNQQASFTLAVVAAALLALAPSAGRAAQTLSPPVTVNSSASTDALVVNVTGTGRAVNGTINNVNNTVSAVRGSSNGAGAGINGVNYGTAGPAAKFESMNANNTKPNVQVTTAGRGQGVLSQITNANNGLAAIQGENLASPYNGIGVLGQGNYLGVNGIANNGTGVWGSSTSYIGVYGTSQNLAIYGNNSSGNGRGVWGHSTSGVGVFGSSTTGWAGYFSGPARVTGNLTVGSLSYSSDRDLKEGIAPADTADVLERVARMPVSTWQFKTRPGVRHLGPMAQDFHTAFGLGDDEKQIGATDIAGVSLAAIQALHAQLRASEAQVAAQGAAIEALQRRLDALQAQLEAPAATASLPVSPGTAAAKAD